MTPLGLYRKESAPVKVVLDAEMLKSDDQILLFHPMRNDFTMAWSAKDFKQFLQFSDHPDYQTKEFVHTEDK